MDNTKLIKDSISLPILNWCWLQQVSATTMLLISRILINLISSHLHFSIVIQLMRSKDKPTPSAQKMVSLSLSEGKLVVMSFFMPPGISLATKLWAFSSFFSSCFLLWNILGLSPETYLALKGSPSSSVSVSPPTHQRLSPPRKRSLSYSSSGPSSPFTLPTPRPASVSSDTTPFDPRTRSFTEEELRPQPILRKRQKQYVSEELKTQKYWEKRKKNNNAARRSREAKRLRENQVRISNNDVTAENVHLLSDSIESPLFGRRKRKTAWGAQNPSVWQNGHATNYSGSQPSIEFRSG